MNYETLYLNDNGTAKVRMTIGDAVLEQDFATDNLDENVKQGLAIFQSELDRNKPAPVDSTVIGKITTVAPADLPVIPVADFEPEQPVEAPVETPAETPVDITEA